MKVLKKHLALCLFFIVVLQGCALSQEQDTVCVTRTGKKYHRCSCHYLKQSSSELSLSDATELGYTPCSICKPGASDTTGEPASGGSASDVQPRPAAKQKSTINTQSQQCTATTKAGTRCKRAASSGGSRCWQHQ